MPSPSRRSDDEAEVQDYLKSVRAGQAGQNPVDQTLARSNRNPVAARIGQQNMADRTNENFREIDRAAREQEALAEDQAREAAAAAKATAKAQETARTNALNYAEKAGMVVETGIDGTREVARHQDGAPKWEPGNIGGPEVIGQARTTIQNEDGTTRTTPNTDIMLGKGGFGNIGETGIPSGTEAQAVYGQTKRDDRGNVTVAPVETKTDPKTGDMTVASKDAEGKVVKLPAGVDWAVRERTARQQATEEELAAVDLREKEIGLQRMYFQPRFEPAKAEYEAAVAARAKLGQGTYREGGKENGRLLKRNSKGEEVPALAEDSAQIKKEREDADARIKRAEAAFRPLELQSATLKAQEDKVAIQKTKLEIERDRMRLGLPEEDGGVSKIVAVSEGRAVDPEMKAAAAVIPDENTPPEQMGPPKPVNQSPDDLALFRGAFSAFNDADKITLGAAGTNYRMIRRNGVDIGSVERDRQSGVPVVVIGKNANATSDLRGFVAFGATTGIPLYAADSPKRKPLTQEAAWVSGVFDAASPTPEQLDAYGETKNWPEGTVEAIDERLRGMGATPEGITRQVRSGELSVQHGEALMRDLYGSTLKADDPLDPATQAAWLEENPDQNAATNSTSTADKNAATEAYLSDWWAANMGKPGVTWRAREAASKALGQKSRFGEKASAVGGGLVDAAGSMVGMLAAPTAMAYLGGYGAATGETQAFTDAMKNYGRASKNTWRGWEGNRKKWFTPEGKKLFKDFETSGAELRAMIPTMDLYADGIDDPKWKAGYSAAVRKVTDAAFALHNSNSEEGWRMTRADLDPSANPELAKLVNGAVMTGDTGLLDLYFESLLQDHGTRQAAGYLDELTSGAGKFRSAVIAGSAAPPEEIGVEMLSTILTAGVGKAAFGGVKAAAATERAAAAIGTASRMARFRQVARGLKSDFASMGMKTGTAQAPLTRLDKASNALIAGIKTGAGNSITEAGEEAAMALAEPGATRQSVMEGAGMGALAGFLLGPVIGGPAALKQASTDGRKRREAATNFAAEYNRIAAGTPGFIPLTPDRAETASFLIDPARRDAALTEAREAAGFLAASIGAAKDENATPAALDQFARAQARMAAATDALIDATIDPVEAVNAIQSVPEADRPLVMAALKVAARRPDSLTPEESKAAGSRRTATGESYFAGNDLSPAGRQTIAQAFPALSGFLGRSAAVPTPTPASNGQNPQGQPAQPAGVSTPPVPVPAMPRGAAGQASTQPTGGVPGGNAAPAPQAQTQVVPANVEAAVYEAARAQDSTLPEIPATVTAAFAAGQPVSVSMARAANVEIPDGYTRSGNTWTPPAAPQDQTGAGNGTGGKPATMGETEGNAPAKDKASPDKAKTGQAEKVVKRAVERFPALKGIVEIDTNGAQGSGGVYVANGKVMVNPADLEADLAGYPTEQAKQARIDAVIEEEIVHVAQIRAALLTGKSVESVYSAIWKDFTPAQQKAAAEAYQGNFTNLDDWQKGAETVRMLVQLRMSGTQTELSKAFSTSVPQSLIDLLKNAVAVLREFLAAGEVPASVQRAIDATEAMLAEMTAAENKPAEKPAKAATGLRIDRSGDTARILDGETLLWNGPASKVDAEFANLQAAMDSPLRLTGEAINAAAARYNLDAATKRELDFATEDLADIMEGLPADQRRPFIEQAIEEWVEALGLQKKKAEEQAEASKDAERRARSKAAREAAKSRLRDKARAILNSDTYPALSAAFQRGRITPKPNAVGLIIARKKAGKKLTEKEMGILRNLSDFDGMPRKQDFAGGGNNVLAREILDLLYARQGEGQMPNVIADKLAPGIDTASEMFEAMDKELSALSNGKQMVDSLDDPNHEWTDAEIAEFEAKREAQAAKEQAEAAPEPQPYATAGDIHGFAVEAFGPEAEFTEKLGAIADFADRFPRDVMPLIRQIVGIEFARHVDGLSIPEWTARNGGEFTADGKVFLDFLRTNTAAEVRAKLGQMPVMDEVAPLASSPTVTPFYSQLSRAIEAKMPKAAPVAQVMAIARDGAKAEEVKWSGLAQAAERLAAENGGKVPKDALLAYLADEGSVRFEEVDSANKQLNDAEMASLREDQAQLDYGYSYDQLIDDQKRTIDELVKQNASNATKFGQYVLPSGENYREVVLAVPSKPVRELTLEESREHTRLSLKVAHREPLNPEEIFKLKDLEERKAARVSAYTSTHFPDVPNYVAHMRTNERDGGLFIEELQSDRHQAGRKKGYTRQEENGSWRAVAQSGAMGAPKGSKEEAQAWIDSHIAEENRHLWKAEFAAKTIEGIAPAPYQTTWPLALFKRALRDAVASGKEWIGWTVGETQNDRFDLSKTLESVEITREGDKFRVFYRTHEGASSDAGVFPAQELPDVIGKELADKVVSDFSGGDPTRKEELKSQMEQARQDMQAYGFDDPKGEGAFDRYKALQAEYQASNPTTKKYEGLDLKVGGSGMKGFYDNMLPKEIGKYVKQWGGKVERARIDAGLKDEAGDETMESRPESIERGRAGWTLVLSDGTNWGAWSREEDAKRGLKLWQDRYDGRQGTPIWRIDITPAMREGVSQGQALFSSPTPQPEFGFNQTTDAGDARQIGLNLTPGTMEKFVANTTAAYQKAPEGKPKEGIATIAAKREGMTNPGKVTATPQRMMDFGTSGSMGTKDQPGLFSSPTNQRAFDFGTDASFSTRNQTGFDFRAKPQTVDRAANEAATSPRNSTPEPTEAQKSAGNYKVGRVTIGGMEISIENPAGSIRSGTDKDGERWEVELQSHYGYLRGTKGKDGDHIDIFIQQGTPLDFTGPVFVVNQTNEDGAFDEHKAVMGPAITTEEQAKAEYLANYSPGWDGAGSIARFESVDAFREWATEKRRIAPAKVTPTDNLIELAQAEFEAGLSTRVEAAEAKLRAASPEGFTKQDANRILGYDESRVVIRELERTGKIAWQAKDAPMMDQTAAEGWKWTSNSAAPAPTQVETPKAAEPITNLDSLFKFFTRFNAYEVTAAEIQAAWEAFKSIESTLLTEVEKMTMKQLARFQGMRKPDNKAQAVRQTMQTFEAQFQSDSMLSYGGVIGRGDMNKARRDAMDKSVSAWTDELLEKRRNTRAELKAAKDKALSNPETKDEWKAFVRKQGVTGVDAETRAVWDKIRDGYDLERRIMDRGESKLTPEQLAAYDEVRGIDRKAKTQAEAERKAVVRGVKADTDSEIVETKHTKTGADLFVVRLADRVEREVYNNLNTAAKRLGGHYSSYRGPGAVPGFQFKTRATAEQFQSITKGETVDRAEAVQERQEDRKNAAAVRLTALAERMDNTADGILNADRKTNTAKRAREAGYAEGKANSMKAMAATLRNLAEAMENGEATHLDGVRTGTHVETLVSLTERAKNDAERAEGLTYSEQESRKGAKPTPDQMDKAKYPYPFLNETAWQWLIENGNNTPGAKLLSRRLEKAFALKPSAKTNGSYITGADMIGVVKDLLSKINRRDYTRQNIEGSFAHYDRLQAMGLTDLPSLRAALREFLQYRGSKAKADPVKQMERDLVGMKIEGFFPTPPAVIERMIQEAGDLEGKRVLEPSAGKGDIVEAAQRAGASVDAIEQHYTLRNILEAKGANLTGRDFMDEDPSPEYDAVLMNPPFENGQDGEHVQRAYQFLKPGGKLVAITGEGIFGRSDRKAQAFRDWLDMVNGSSEKLAEGSFKSSFRPTGVNTRLVVIEKPAESLFSSPTPQQPDLFTAASAPDAAKTLGSVKVGRMNALAAYRALTAKRNAGKTLTADEEQKLLDAEQALGQKLAFDMDGLATDNESLTVRNQGNPVAEQSSVTGLPPVFGQNRRNMQDEMSRAGEMEAGGQMSLLSSPSGPSSGNEASRRIPGSPIPSGRDGRSQSGSVEGIREQIARAVASGSQGALGAGGESFVDGLGADRVLKTIKPRGVWTYKRTGGLTRSTRFEDVELKAKAIRLLGGLDTQAFQADGQNYLIQERGTPITQTEYEALELPFNIRPHSGAQIYRVEMDGRQFIISDLNRDNFLKKPNGEIGVSDLVVGEVETGKGPMDDVDSRLLSSPTPEVSAAIQQALEQMPTKYRQVYEDVEAGLPPAAVIAKHKISEKGLTNILNQVRARLSIATAAATSGLNPVMRGDQFVGGRPDLALSTVPEIATVDQARNESSIPDARPWDEVFSKAGEMLAADYQGTYDMLLAKARDLQPMTDMEVAASKMIISRETMAGKITEPADRVKLGMMIYGYREIGTETARSLAIRRDPHLTPAERHAQFIAEALFTPDAATRNRMKKNPRAAETILAGWMKRVDTIEAELRAQGIDIRASLAEFNARKEEITEASADNPQTKAIIDETFRRLTRREKAVIEAIRSGALATKAAFLTGMSVQEVLEINGQFVKDIKSAMAEAAKRFLTQSLASSASVNPMDAILAELGIYDNSLIDDTQPDFVDRRNEKPRAPRKPRAPKPEAPTPPQIPDITPEQQAELDEAWQRFQDADPSTWTTLFQTESERLTPMVGQVAFERWKGEVMQPWSATEQTLPGTEAPRLPINETTGTFDTEATNTEGTLFPQPVNGTTGTFDINDTLAMKQVIDAFALARGTKMDALMEFWRMSILTGPQTHVVNTTSNLLNLAFNLLPRRAVEASLNAALGLVGQGDPTSATFREFGPMLASLRAGASLAARNALRSWKMESRGLFESYAQAQALQMEFSGVGTEYIPPALGGKLGRIMRSLSFRAMTAADEFMKSLYGQMEAAAQAHRIAREEEKLTGAAYGARVADLMIPGSVAWVRAVDGSRRVTFQDELDGSDPQAIRRIDQLADLVKKGRSMPWLGRPITFLVPFVDTPTNIFKQALQYTPIGGGLALIDMARALRRRIASKNLTPEEARAEAAQLYDRARLVQDMTNQTIGLMVWLALDGLVGGEDDEELPFITGTVPFKSTRKGERDNSYAVMPAMSIRMGGLQFSYSRFEPFAIVLAGMADLRVEMNRRGGFQPEVVSEFLMRFKDQINEKTFLQGVSNMLNAIEDPDRFAERLTANVAAGFVPNFIRQPIREINGGLPDANPRADDGFLTAVAKRVGYSIVPQAAPARMSVWGEEIPTNRGEMIGGNRVTDAAFRIFDPTNATLNPDIDPIDGWIYQWNLRTADSKERVAIEPIGNSITGKVPGEKRNQQFPLTVEEQAEANRNAGRMARAMLGNDWRGRELTEESANAIKDAISEAQTFEKRRLRQIKIAQAMANPE